MADTKLINWNLLHTFVVIVESRSVSKAADVLRRGQPAVSAALKNLEEQLGCTLVLRSSKSFTLTEAGRALYPEARDICNSVDRISTLVSDTGGDLKGAVNVAIASHMVSPLLDEAFSGFHDTYPRASFSISVLRISEILERIASGFSAFGIAPISVKRPELDYVHLYREYCGFYCGPKHRFFGQKNLPLSALENEKAVTYPSAVFSDDLQSLAEMRHRVKFADPFVGVSNNTEELKRMIIAGLGIGPIPVHVAQRDVEDGLLWRLPPYEDAMQVDVYLISNPSVTPSRTEAAFMTMLTESVSALPLADRTYPLDKSRELSA